MAGNENTIDTRKAVGLARAWVAYIRMIAAAIITKQAKINERVENGDSPLNATPPCSPPASGGTVFSWRGGQNREPVP